MSYTYSSVWWSVDVPSGWLVEEEEECTLFFRENGVGALQISAYRNETREVTEEDLSEFRRTLNPGGFACRAVRTAALTGFRTRRSNDDHHWEHWYLRARRLLVFVTYNCASENEGLDGQEVYEIVQTLRPTLQDAITDASN